MTEEVLLRGIAWNHSRALPPLVATSQRFEELFPGVEIRWEKRSLHGFGHADLASLAAEYDLLVIDHPAMGDVHEHHALLALNKSLEDAFLENLASDSVGRSYETYSYEGELFALPIDAAALAASYRPDLLRRGDIAVPETWNDVLGVARKTLAIMPGFHPDVFLNFIAICVSLGAEVGEGPEQLVETKIGLDGLEILRELASYMPPHIYQWNPIAVYENMANSDRYAYCPFAFSYSNYSRVGFAKNLILFSNSVALRPGRPFQGILGGTGIAVSARCKATRVAIDYLRQIVGVKWQRTLYGLSGGQPARRSAWTDSLLNQITNRFFEQTLDSVEGAYVRPQYPGYVQLQGQAGLPIVCYLREGGRPADVLESVNSLYRDSLKIVRSKR